MIAMYASRGSLVVNSRRPNAALQKKEIITKRNVMLLFAQPYIENIVSLTTYNGNY